jgi:large subunit ribosomal protein L4
MKLAIQDLNGNPQGELEVGFTLVEGGRGTQAVHDTIVAYLANQRSGTACTKTMGEVQGSGKKPWRQKGTGRARAGSYQSPLWRGGGVVFGPKPRDFSLKVNKKTKQLALRKALTERIKGGDVMVINDLKLESHQTKGFVSVLNKLQLTGTTLLVDAAVEKNLLLASRNVPNVEVTTADLLNTYQVLRPAKLVFTKDGFAKLEARLNKY